ncbi:MAG: LamG domain-containing protein [Planctomycetes bacterium]|nr:LamG domain-containing protein [Planctomycetota bacterium]
MCKKLFFLISLFLLLMLTGNAMAQIDPATVDTGHVYLLDDVSGTQVQDDSANSNAGTIVGDPQVVAGLNSGALQFDGIDDGINIPDSQFINTTNGPWPDRTIIAVFNCADVDKSEKQTVFEEGGRTRGLTIYVHEGLVYAGGWNRAEYDWNPGSWISTPIGSNEWHAVALIIRDGAEAVEDDKFEMWMDGILIGKAPGGHIHNHSNDNSIGYTLQNNVFHDDDGSGDGWYFEGAIDEVWILNEALTETDLRAWVGKVLPEAFSPIPEDGALYEDTWVNLSWKPGGFAVSHNVYLGDNFDDVNSGAEGTFQGNQAITEFIAGFPGFAFSDGLVPGTTYYWRIDEVNETEPNSPWKGKIWSFSVPSKTAHNPIPADGTKFTATEVELSWTPGFGALLHNIYFGDNFDDVNNATGALPNADATFTPATLELDKTYYWRIDEFDGSKTIKGNVWSFKTMPDIPITDPNFICWWTLEEGTGTRVLDWSGHDNHGDFVNDPKWVDGYDGSALQFDGVNDSVIYYLPEEQTWSAYTVALWAKADVVSQSLNSCVFANHMTYATDTPSMQISYDDSDNYQYHGPIDAIIGPATLGWIHLCVTGEDSNASLYYNGDLVTSFDHGTGDTVFSKFAIGINRAEDNWFEGSIDDCRVYNRALTQEEVQLAMRGDPLLAWKPSPVNGSLLNLRDAGSLSWSPGDNASEHDVYFGTVRDAVSNADVSDTTGVYRGRQGITTFNTTQDVEWGGGPYYWRIDEVNTDGTVSIGRIWNFTEADFIGVDDFESYNDLDPADPASNRIFNAWIDGFDNPAINGSIVGYANPPFAERTIVHGGSQAMPFAYDNAVGKSDATLTLTDTHDWTEEGVSVLSIWFQADATNADEPMYVVLNGTAGITNNIPNAAQIDVWTEWKIDLQAFADQGINLTNVNTITLGFGNRTNPVVGGTGIVFFDDIRLYRPAP